MPPVALALPMGDERTAPPADLARELLSQVAAGDPAAFGALHVLARPRVLGLARILLRDDGHAQDVTQEVFWQIWRSAAAFDPARGSAWGWILMLTHGRSVDRIRSVTSQQRRDRASLSAEMRPTADHDEVVEQVMRGVEYAQVRAGMAGLTVLQRESVELHYFSAHTFLQIATQLDVPVATVKTRIRDGLIRLRAAVVELQEAAT